MCLDTGDIPKLWKTSVIIPIPKRNKVQEPNDFRPVALTSNIMKCFERLFLTELLKETRDLLDPHQFAYRSKRSVEDATLVYLHRIYEHLDRAKSSIRSLFVDFSSAFNTIAPHCLVRMLLDANVNPRLILCIQNFLSSRIQSVKAGNHQSQQMITNIGAPQGCVLSPVLFSLYTSKCTSTKPSCSILKYADDTVITGYLFNDPNEYVSQVDEFVSWCDDHHLSLNTSKTKEMIFDFRRDNTQHEPLRIHGNAIEQVHEYKYLGTIIDDKLSWKENCKSIQTKSNQRMFFLRKLKKFQIDRTILTLFYQSIIQSVITFNFICTFGNMSNEQKGEN